MGILRKTLNIEKFNNRDVPQCGTAVGEGGLMALIMSWIAYSNSSSRLGHLQNNFEQLRSIVRILALVRGDTWGVSPG